MQPKDNFTIGQVALQFDIPTRTVYRAVLTGRLRAYRFNARCVRITSAFIAEWVAASEVRALASTRTNRRTPPNSKSLPAPRRRKILPAA